MPAIIKTNPFILRNKDSIEQVAETIQKANKIVLIAHQNPDGDAVGSTLGLKLAFEAIGKQAQVILPDAAAQQFKFLPHFNTLIDASIEKDKAKQIIADADVLIAADFSQTKRAGHLQKHIQKFNGFKINIDHHPEPEAGYQFYMHRTAASSTCELSVEFLQEALPDLAFTKQMATCFYTGLVTDTGCFKYAVTPETFATASFLLQTGIVQSEITAKLFDENPIRQLRVLGFVLSEKLTVLKSHKTAYITLSYAESQQFKLQKGDMEGVVNYALSLSGINLGVLFREETPKVVKMSFRSNAQIAANAIAKGIFGGGGHQNAAGAKFNGTLEDTLNLFKKELPKYT